MMAPKLRFRVLPLITAVLARLHGPPDRGNLSLECGAIVRIDPDIRLRFVQPRDIRPVIATIC
jgi:hypothetical protein